MNKLILLAIAALALPALHTTAYADDESKTVIKKQVDVDGDDREVTEEVTRESDDDDASYTRETTIERDDGSSTTTTTTTSEDD